LPIIHTIPGHFAINHKSLESPEEIRIKVSIVVLVVRGLLISLRCLMNMKIVEGLMFQLVSGLVVFTIVASQAKRLHPFKDEK